MSGIGSTWERTRVARKLGIRARLMVLALIAIVPLVLDRVRDIGTDRAERIEAASEQALRLARQGMATQSEVIVSARAFLQVITNTYTLDRSDPSAREDCVRLLSKTVAQTPWLKVVSVVEPSGRIFCSSHIPAIDLDVSKNVHINQAIENDEFVVSDYFVGAHVGPTLVTAWPRRDSNGSLDVVFTALLDLTWFGRVIGDVSAQPGSVALMVDGNGTLLARHPSRESWIGRSFKEHPVVGAILAAEDGVYTGEAVDGVRRIFGFVRIPGTSARFVFGLDESEVLRRVNRETWLAVLALGALTAFLLTAIWFGGERLLVQPIRSLTGTAQRFGRGEFGARASDGAWAAEFVPLATALDDMAKQLAAREQDLHDSNSQLAELAKLDGLTGLMNRRTFNERLGEEWKTADKLKQPLALILLDVDHFKRFNDRYGHPQGDACLRKVAEVLKASTRASHDTVPALAAAMPPSFRRMASRRADVAARYGGEEFALLLPGASEEAASRVAERLRQGVLELDLPHEDSAAGRLTISLGVAGTVPTGTNTPQQLIDAADAALYVAKRNGRNTAVAHATTELSLVS
jgi:GGDEF domain-containing protein